jgi:F420-0:gamma-glutamyl ligase
MPSEPIAHPTPLPINPRVTRRRVVGVAVIGIAATAFASCAQGSSPEAERGRELDIERTSVVDNLQATETARLISGTPRATPPTTPEE